MKFGGAGMPISGLSNRVDVTGFTMSLEYCLAGHFFEISEVLRFSWYAVIQHLVARVGHELRVFLLTRLNCERTLT